jgi:Holliday junction DNA helicase RuvB
MQDPLFLASFTSVWVTSVYPSEINTTTNIFIFNAKGIYDAGVTKYIESSFSHPDTLFEKPLRPSLFAEFAGQRTVTQRLEVMIQAAKQRKEALDHCLFSGPPGLGKTTLAHILAKSMETQLVATSGPVLEKPGDLAGLLTSLKEGDILFIDEIHRLNKQVEEYLYSAMEDFSIDLLIDSGPAARSVQLKLNRFTLAGATTRSGLLSAPLRSRFPFTGRLDYYSTEILEQILLRSSQILRVQLEESAAYEIACRSRGTPRIANNLLRWVRDFSQVRSSQQISKEIALAALAMLEIDEKGLDEMDKRILSLIIDCHQGGPVGVNTIAAAVGEEPDTIQEVYEPYLLMQGMLERTPRGRKASLKAYQHLNRLFPKKEGGIL